VAIDLGKLLRQVAKAAAVISAAIGALLAALESTRE
jgi:hypothetical protein